MILRIQDMVPGHKQCCICTEFIPFDELWTDANGDRWDMCLECGKKERS